MGIIILLILILFILFSYIRNKQIEKQLRIKSAECELIKALGNEFEEKYEERSNNIEITNNTNFND